MQHKTPSKSTPIETLAEAIQTCRMLEITYNGTPMSLHPYQMFVRNGAVYLSAFNPNKNWRSQEDWRLGHFNISGISDIAIADGFEPSSQLDTSLPREGDTLLMAMSE